MSANPRVEYWRERQRDDQLRQWAAEDRTYRARLRWWRRALVFVFARLIRDVCLDLVEAQRQRGEITGAQAAALRLSVRRRLEPEAHA